ncbi:MAG TPA: hypothetical protein VHG32_24455, partial [Thermoanaerobaculia bacterium]|nr:hypothetical protein [Thermoanaerobaculia bacterium]
MPIERTAASSPRDGEPGRPLSMVIPSTEPLPRGAWETLFDQLAESSHEIRAAKLLQIAEQDPALARRLADMLAADARGGSALDVPLGERAPGFVAAALEQAAV